MNAFPVAVGSDLVLLVVGGAGHWLPFRLPCEEVSQGVHGRSPYAHHVVLSKESDGAVWCTLVDQGAKSLDDDEYIATTVYLSLGTTVKGSTGIPRPRAGIQ